MNIAASAHIYNPSYRQEQLQAISVEAKSYAAQTQDKSIVLQGETTEGPVVQVIPYEHRLSEHYLSKQRRVVTRRLRGLGRNGIFVTLTVNPRQYSSLIEAGQAANRQFNILMTEFRRKCDVKYVRITESQSANANVHLHVVLNVPWISYEWLREHWKLGHVWVEKVIGGSRRTLEWYMSKEMEKSLIKIDGNYTPTTLLLWATNMRYLSNSRSLDEHSETNSNGHWEYLGVFPSNLFPDSGGGRYPLADFAYFRDTRRGGRPKYPPYTGP